VDELGFEGAVITDGIEMRAVTRRYGLAGAAVRALAAGADAICVGGEHADEADTRHLRDAIVEAVTAGILPEERLAEAAKRVAQLAAWTAAARSGAVRWRDPGPDGSPLGLAAARRAVRLTTTPEAAELPLPGPAHVLEFAPPSNIAIGAETPWGVGEPLTTLLPGTTTLRLTADELGDDGELPVEALATARGRSLVLVVRDLHRHRWMAAAVRRVLASRPEAIVVELGVPATVVGRVHIATHGASRAACRAAAEVLAGRRAAEALAVSS